MLSIHRVLQHRTRALVALVVLALAALALTACGGGGGNGGGSGSADAGTLVSRTFSKLNGIKSGKANLTLRLAGSGQALDVTASGPFERGAKGQLPSFDFALDVGLQGGSLKAAIVSNGSRVFVEFGGNAYEVPRSLVKRMAAGGTGTNGSDLLNGLHPERWVRDVRAAGEETVGGVTTEHITANVAVSAVLDDLDGLLAKVRGQLPAAAQGQIPTHLDAKTREQIEQAIKAATVDVWIGKDDGLLRKLTLAMRLEMPKSSGGGVDRATLDASVVLTDLNAPQTIQIPQSAQPLSALLGQVQGLLGGALGGANPFGGSGGSGAQADAYTQCLQDAGGNAKKAQKCAALLTK